MKQQRSLYEATKKTIEVMAHTYSHLHHLIKTGLLFFSLESLEKTRYGYYIIFKAITNGEPIYVFKHGDLSKDFIYIVDIV